MTGVEHLQNVHPLLVHFPLAFLPGAALFYVVAWASGREGPAWTGLWLLALGTLSAAVAVATGLRADEGVMVDPTVRSALLDHHRRWMLGTLASSVVLLAWAVAARPFPVRLRGPFVVLLLGVLAAMAYGADFGGRLVYDYNAGGNACAQPIEFTK